MHVRLLGLGKVHTSKKQEWSPVEKLLRKLVITKRSKEQETVIIKVWEESVFVGVLLL